MSGNETKKRGKYHREDKNHTAIDLIPLDCEASAQVRNGMSFIRFKPSKYDLMYLANAVAKKVGHVSGQEIREAFEEGAHFAFSKGIPITFALTGSCRYRVLNVGYIEYCKASEEILLLI